MQACAHQWIKLSYCSEREHRTNNLQMNICNTGAELTCICSTALNDKSFNSTRVSPTPQSGWPAMLNQPITRTQKDRQPIKVSAPLIVYKQSIVYCCLASRLFGQPSSNISSCLHSFKFCSGTGRRARRKQSSLAVYHAARS